MWFVICNKKDCKDRDSVKFFEKKLDAQKYISANVLKRPDSLFFLQNGDISLIDDSIQVGSNIYVIDENKKEHYGTINDIFEYLISIEKSDGDIVELTKNRLNKELVLGNFSVS